MNDKYEGPWDVIQQYPTYIVTKSFESKDESLFECVKLPPVPGEDREVAAFLGIQLPPRPDEDAVEVAECVKLPKEVTVRTWPESSQGWDVLGPAKGLPFIDTLQGLMDADSVELGNAETDAPELVPREGSVEARNAVAADAEVHAFIHGVKGGNHKATRRTWTILEENLRVEDEPLRVRCVRYVYKRLGELLFPSG